MCKDVRLEPGVLYWHRVGRGDLHGEKDLHTHEIYSPEVVTGISLFLESLAGFWAFSVWKLSSVNILSIFMSLSFHIFV